MESFDPAVVARIHEVYEDLTAVEKSIADFFIQNQASADFSSRSIAGKLYVSEASLSRFAKKCGYKGFREFIYNYEKSVAPARDADVNELTRKVLFGYRDLLEKSQKLVDEQQMCRVAKLLSNCKKVYVYGMGSSEFAAQEFKLRFMRIGLNVEAVGNPHMIKMTAALVDSETLIIAFSVSGKTPEILTGIRIASEQGAKVILVTANSSPALLELCDEVLYIATRKDLEIGLEISPQFPILVMVDVFFSYYLNTDCFYKSARHRETITALYKENFEE